MKRAAKYRRISNDREGRELGVDRQDVDLDELAERCGYLVVASYCDNDIGASTRSRKRRPEYEQMLADARDGAFDVVIAYTSSRLTRRPMELEGQISLAEQHGIEFDYVKSPSFDLNTAAGRRIARILAATDAGEAEDTAERLVREREAAAKAGRDAGGPRPYGYEADRMRVVPVEAEIIGQSARRVLAGESLGSVYRDLNDRRVPTARGGAWSRQTLRKMLASARISGRREYIPVSGYTGGRRPIIGEIIADATWPAIISPADSDRLRALLGDPARHKPRVGFKYALTRVLVCDTCKTPMVGRPRSRQERRYVCNPASRAEACGRLSVNAEFAEDVVRDMVLVALDSDEFRTRLAERGKVDPAIRRAVTGDEEQLLELAEAYGAKRLTMGEWLAARDPIEQRLAMNRSRLERANGTSALANFIGTYDEMLGRWKRRNDSQRRAIVTAVLNRVVVKESKGKFDTDRFDPDWRV